MVHMSIIEWKQLRWVLICCSLCRHVESTRPSSNLCSPFGNWAVQSTEPILVATKDFRRQWKLGTCFRIDIVMLLSLKIGSLFVDDHICSFNFNGNRGYSTTCFIEAIQTVENNQYYAFRKQRVATNHAWIGSLENPISYQCSAAVVVWAIQQHGLNFK